MATISTTTLTTVIRNEYFLNTITVTSSGIINSINCVKNFIDESINVSISTSSVTISGTNLGIEYIDISKYVEKGSSGPTEDAPGEQTATQVVGVLNVPKDKDLFEFNQDLKDDVIRTYTLTVTETAGVIPVTSTSTFTLTQTIRNNWTFGKLFLEDYFGLPNAP